MKSSSHSFPYKIHQMPFGKHKKTPPLPDLADWITQNTQSDPHFIPVRMSNFHFPVIMIQAFPIIWIPRLIATHIMNNCRTFFYRKREKIIQKIFFPIQNIRIKIVTITTYTIRSRYNSLIRSWSGNSRRCAFSLI